MSSTLKSFDLLARFGASISVSDKIVAAIALAACPSIGLCLSIAQDRQGEIDRVELERSGVSMLRFISAANDQAARFVRVGGFESDMNLIDDARAYVGVVEDHAEANPWMASQAADAIAAIDRLATAPAASRHAALVEIHAALAALAQTVGIATQLDFDAEPGVRMPNHIREEHLPELDAKLTAVQATLAGRPRRDAAQAAARDLSLAAASLSAASGSAINESVAADLAIETERLQTATAALEAQIARAPLQSGARDVGLMRALRDAEAAITTLERATLTAADNALASRLDELKSARLLNLAWSLMSILALVAAAYVFARRTVLSPLNQLMDATASLSTGDTDREITQQDRHDEIGEIARYLAASNEFVKARIAAEAARQSAERDNAAKSKFITTMTHELRTPLNAIIGYGELLLEDATERGSEDAADLARLLGAARHLLQLISDVLDLSVVDGGGLELRTELVDPLAVFEDAAAASRDAARANRTRLTIACPKPIAPFPVDRARLRQSLAKLFANAAKFTKDGAIEGRLEEYLRDGRRALRFVVSDTGIGISPGQMKHLFDPFTRGREGLTQSHGGMGVGLALTQRLARAMGGDVSVQSEPGKGSTFTLWISETERDAQSPQLSLAS